jgi:hypothetical protein
VHWLEMQSSHMRQVAVVGTCGSRLARASYPHLFKGEGYNKHSGGCWLRKFGCRVIVTCLTTLFFNFVKFRPSDPGAGPGPERGDA